jgi:hypothetical protein
MSPRVFLVVVADTLVVAALLFVPAWTPSWPAGWVFMALFSDVTITVTCTLIRDHPELLEERMSSPVQGGQPLWDRATFVRAPAALRRLVYPHATGRREVRVVGRTCPATGLGSTWHRAIVLRHVRGLPGERVPLPGSEATGGPGTERRYDRPAQAREASLVLFRSRVFPSYRASARFRVGSPLLLGPDSPHGPENGPRGPNAKERTGRLHRVRPERPVQARASCLVIVRSLPDRR